MHQAPEAFFYMGRSRTSWMERELQKSLLSSLLESMRVEWCLWALLDVLLAPCPMGRWLGSLPPPAAPPLQPSRTVVLLPVCFLPLCPSPRPAISHGSGAALSLGNPGALTGMSPRIRMPSICPQRVSGCRAQGLSRTPTQGMLLCSPRSCESQAGQQGMGGGRTRAHWMPWLPLGPKASAGVSQPQRLC